MNKNELAMFQRGLEAFTGFSRPIFAMVREIEDMGFKVFVGPKGFPIILEREAVVPTTAKPFIYMKKA